MNDAFWSMFRETGDPVCYLLCKAGERETGADAAITADCELNSTCQITPTSPL